MREIAATQASAGLTPALFEAMAEVYAALAETPLAAEAPEAIDAEPDLEHVLEGLSPRRPTILMAAARAWRNWQTRRV